MYIPLNLIPTEVIIAYGVLAKATNDHIYIKVC
jgi:hypothetical protein